MDLNLIWFLLLGVLLAGYAALDGFDFGVGILSVLTSDDHEKRILITAIGPIWDGNEVWLVTFGGAMFAAFPEVYATVFSGFYVAFMAVLFVLILRAVSLEFRSKLEGRAWRRAWDLGFFLSSLLAPILFGVAVGASLTGIRVDSAGIYRGGFFDLLLPAHHVFYPLLVGVFTASLFTLHGAVYLLFKTEGPLEARIRRWVWHAFGVFLVLYLGTTIVTLVTVPRALANFENWPWAWVVVAISVLAIGLIPRGLFVNKPWQAFAASSLLIVSLVGLLGIALFPNLVTSSLPGGLSLDIYNAASSHKTLAIMGFIAAAGMPFVLGYTAIIYWTFRGKVRTPGY